MTPDERKGYNAGLDRATEFLRAAVPSHPRTYREEIEAEALSRAAMLVAAFKMPKPSHEWLWTGPAAGD